MCFYVYSGVCMDVGTCLTVAKNFNVIEGLVSRLETWLVVEGDVYIYVKNVKIRYPSSERFDVYRVRLLPCDLVRLLIGTLRDLQGRVDVLASDYEVRKRIRHILGTLYGFLPVARVVWLRLTEWGSIYEYVVPSGYVPIVKRETSVYSCKYSRFVRRSPGFTIPFVVWTDVGAAPILLGDWNTDDLSIVNEDYERITELVVSKPGYF